MYHVDDSQETPYVIYPPTGNDSIVVNREDLDRLQPAQYLNDTLV
jgi:Ulp1 family protease